VIGPVLLSAVMSWQMAGSDPANAPTAAQFLTAAVAVWPSGTPIFTPREAQTGLRVSIHAASAADEFTTPDEHGAWLSHALIGAYVAASATDLSTTMFCRGAKSCVELNPALRPLQDRPLAFGLVKGAASAAIAYLLIRVHRTHPRVVRVVAGVLAAGSFAIAIRNEREAR
jgi:hypothetical protein